MLHRSSVSTAAAPSRQRTAEPTARMRGERRRRPEKNGAGGAMREGARKGGVGRCGGYKGDVDSGGTVARLKAC